MNSMPDESSPKRDASTNNLVNLQIPIDKDFKKAIAAYVYDMGFNSLQDFTRVMYKSIFEDKLTFHIVPRGYKASKLNLTDADYKEFRQNKLGKYLQKVQRSGELSDYH